MNIPPESDTKRVQNTMDPVTEYINCIMLSSPLNLSPLCHYLQTYVTSSDKDFVAATIQAIGRCASNISEVTDSCMNGLMGLMSNRDGKA